MGRLIKASALVLISLLVLFACQDISGPLTEKILDSHGLTEYTLTLLSDDGGSVSIDEVVTLADLDIEIMASAESGYTFYGWEQVPSAGSGRVAGDLNSSATTVQIKEGDVTLRARFILAPRELTLSADSGGSITFPTTSPYTVDDGVAVTITAAPDEDYIFDQWIEVSGNTTIADEESANTTISITGEDAEIQATFALTTYTLSFSGAGTHYLNEVEVSTDQIITALTPTTISVTPAEGFSFTEWTSSGFGEVLFEDSRSATTTMTISGGDATISASFTSTPRNIYTNAGTGGLILLPVSSPFTIGDGTTTNISASANTDFIFTGWEQTSGTGAAVFGDETSANTTVNVTGGDVELSASFEPATYTLSLSAPSGQGTDLPFTFQAVDANTDIAISVTPVSGYTFTGWTKSGGTGTPSFADGSSASTTVQLSGGNVSLQANFSNDPRTIYFPDSVENGTINPPVDQLTVGEGAATSIEALSTEDDYEFDQWSYSAVLGASASFANEYASSTTVTITGGSGETSGINLDASFKLKSYEVTLEATEGGTVDSSFDITALTDHSITATPDDGKQFIRWDQTGGDGTAVIADSSSNSTTVNVSGGDVTLQAVFSSSPRDITLTAVSGGSIVIPESSPATVADGIALPIEAEADADYEFSGWTKTAGSGTASFEDATSASTTVIATDNDITVTASFELTDYTLTMAAGIGGSVTPETGAVEALSNVSITATPETGFEFSHWEQTDGSGTATIADSTSATTTVSLSGADVEISAVFSQMERTITFEVNPDEAGSITIPDGVTTLTLGDGALTTIETSSDTNDYNFTGWTESSDTNTTVTFEDSTNDNTTLTVSGGNATIEANYTLRSYTLTQEATSGGSVSTASQSVTALSSYDITATPDSGSSFVRWDQTDGTGTATIADNTDPSTTVIVSGGDVTLQAVFSTTLREISLSSGLGGSITVPDSTPVTVGDGIALPITAAADVNYQFAGWSKSSGTGTVSFADSDSPTTNVTVIGGDAEIEAAFELIDYTLTMTATEGGSVSPGAATLVTAEDNTSISATPASSFYFSHWEKASGDGTVTFADKNAATTTVNITGGDATVRGEFLRYERSVSLSVEPSGTGTIDAPAAVKDGLEYDITATPAAGYQFVEWSKASGTGTPNFDDEEASETILWVNGGDVTIEAAFELKSYTVALDVVGSSRGNITAPSTSSVSWQHGTGHTVTAQNVRGAIFDEWSFTPASGSSGTASFSNASALSTTVSVTGPGTIKANYIHLSAEFGLTDSYSLANFLSPKLTTVNDVHVVGNYILVGGKCVSSGKIGAVDESRIVVINGTSKTNLIHQYTFPLIDASAVTDIDSYTAKGLPTTIRFSLTDSSISGANGVYSFASTTSAPALTDLTKESTTGLNYSEVMGQSYYISDNDLRKASLAYTGASATVIHSPVVKDLSHNYLLIRNTIGKTGTLNIIEAGLSLTSVKSVTLAGSLMDLTKKTYNLYNYLYIAKGAYGIGVVRNSTNTSIDTMYILQNQTSIDPHSTQYVEVSGNYLIAVNNPSVGNNYIEIYDIHGENGSIANPYLLNTIFTGSDLTITGFDVSGNYVYITEGTTLKVYNFTTSN